MSARLNRSRAWRRKQQQKHHHRQYMKARRILHLDHETATRYANRYKNDRKPCSCDMCSPYKYNKRDRRLARIVEDEVRYA